MALILTQESLLPCHCANLGTHTVCVPAFFPLNESFRAKRGISALSAKGMRSPRHSVPRDDMLLILPRRFATKQSDAVIACDPRERGNPNRRVIPSEARNLRFCRERHKRRLPRQEARNDAFPRSPPRFARNDTLMSLPRQEARNDAFPRSPPRFARNDTLMRLPRQEARNDAFPRSPRRFAPRARQA